MNGSETDLLKQIHATRRYCLDGLILFDYAHTGEKYTSVLTESVFKTYKKEPIEQRIEQKENEQQATGKKKRGRRK